MPYRADLPVAGDQTFDAIVDLGALDVDAPSDGWMAALMPDTVSIDQIAQATGVSAAAIRVSPAIGRDQGSVWVLRPRQVYIGRVRIVPAGTNAATGGVQLIDGDAFGTGLHPTTAQCLEAIDEATQDAVPEAMLDVGTGSGVLAIAALILGVPRALGIDIDDDALGAAAENARRNGVDSRLELAHGGPGTVNGVWPLVVANVLAAPLIEMAPSLVQRVAHAGQLILSGVSDQTEPDVTRTYRRLGMHLAQVKSRAGWVAIVLNASW